MNDNLQRDVHQVLADIVASTPSTPLNPFVAESAADEVSWGRRPTVASVRASLATDADAFEATVRELPRPHGRRWLSTAAVLIVLAAVAGLAIVVAARRTIDVRPAGSMQQSWMRLADPAGLFIASDHVDRVEVGTAYSSSNSAVRIAEVTPFQGGYVAVGATGYGFRSTGSVWTSADGISWSADDQQANFGVPAEAAPRATYGTELEHVATNGQRLVAIGNVYGSNPFYTLAAWWSDDGVHWTKSASRFERVQPDRASYPNVDGVIATSSGFIAFGEIGIDGSNDTTGRMWVSGDGTTWKDATEGLVGDHVRVAGIRAVGDRLLAFGSVGPSDRGRAQFWQSTDDGASWTTIDTPSPTDGTHTAVGRVLRSSFGLVAFGDAHEGDRSITGNPGPTAVLGGTEDIVEWISTDDGNTWQGVDTTSLNTADFDTITAAASGPNGIVLSIRRVGSVPFTTVVERTADGRHFQVIPFDAEQELDTLTSTDQGYLGTGSSNPPEKTEAADWEKPQSTSLWFLPA